MVESRCQLNQRVEKWLLWPFGRKPHALPMLMGRKELLRTLATQAVGKFTLRPIECHESQLIACVGLYVLALLQTLGRHRDALELHLRK
jgi:hypothetical protein